MTPQEIQERNSNIALMLGWKKHNHGSYHTWTNDKSIYHIYDSILQFHSDWNWLMESVEFIEKLGYESLLGGGEYYYPEKDRRYIQHFIKEDEVIYHESKNKIEAVFVAVSDFAKLYNERKL
jgi:hypothetical protein